jgi:hypothetical protein
MSVHEDLWLFHCPAARFRPGCRFGAGGSANELNQRGGSRKLELWKVRFYWRSPVRGALHSHLASCHSQIISNLTAVAGEQNGFDDGPWGDPFPASRQSWRARHLSPSAFLRVQASTCFPLQLSDAPHCAAFLIRKSRDRLAGHWWTSLSNA